MKIELDDKDSAALQGSILDAIKSLSPDKRDELVSNVMMTFLTGPDKERTDFDASRKDYGWQSAEAKARYRSTRERVLEELATGAMDEARKRVATLIQTDKLLLETYDKVKNVLVERFPDMVQHAMTAWFVNGMQEIGVKFGEMFGMASKMQMFNNEVRERLGLPAVQG